MDKLKKLFELEQERNKKHISFIASENYISSYVRSFVGSQLTHKYSEGYPNKRYYSGCEIIDKIENLAIERCKKLFNAKFANVQPHSGSQANLAAIMSVLNFGDSILSMNLSSGGHLTHGHSASIIGKLYKIHFYNVSKNNYMIDYDEIEKIAINIKPKLIICGYSCYSRFINFEKFKKIANKVEALLLIDAAHFIGIVAAKLCDNPIFFGDIVTATTHKTLRGPRGGIILTNNEDIAKKINKAIFPGIQGGPFNNNIAGKAASFWEASKKSFITYQKNVLKSSKLLAKIFMENNFELLTKGTDNHMFIVNLSNNKLTGLECSEKLYDIGISVNKNLIPYDKRSPMITSGIRIGTPAPISRNLKLKDISDLGNIMVNVLNNKLSIKKAKIYVSDILKHFPLI